MFVPEKHRDHYLNQVAKYADPAEDTEKGNPANQPLVAAINTVRLALAWSLYTDKPELYPDPGAMIWWEVWLRAETRPTFEAAARQLELTMRDHALTFPDREVILVCATAENLSRIVANTDAVVELRLARDTPGLFMAMDGAEQRLWSDDLAKRIVPPDSAAPAVCRSIRHDLSVAARNDVRPDAQSRALSDAD